MVPAVSSSFHWPISAGRASPETGSTRWTSSAISSAPATRSHTWTWSTLPSRYSWYPPLYFNRPIVSGPVAFHGVVNEAVPSVASSTPLTYSWICWLVASYTPARWVQPYVEEWYSWNPAARLPAWLRIVWLDDVWSSRTHAATVKLFVVSTTGPAVAA